LLVVPVKGGAGKPRNIIRKTRTIAGREWEARSYLRKAIAGIQDVINALTAPVLRSGTIRCEEGDIVNGVNTNSRLSENLQAGDYTIEATAYYAQTSGDLILTH
jgi:hypothetical protein